MKNLTVAEGLYVEIEYVLSESGPDGEVLEECPAEQAFGFKVGAEWSCSPWSCLWAWILGGRVAATYRSYCSRVSTGD